jgi:hypothetical protein
MINEIHISITQLEVIIEEAKKKQKNNSSLSNTIRLKSVRERLTHTGSDNVECYLKCVYAECNDTFVCQNY